MMMIIIIIIIIIIISSGLSTSMDSNFAGVPKHYSLKVGGRGGETLPFQVAASCKMSGQLQAPSALSPRALGTHSAEGRM